MKILFVSCTFPPDNSATAGVIKKLIPYLQKDGCQIDGLTIKKSLHDASRLVYEGANVFYADSVLCTPHPLKGWRDIAYAVNNHLKKRLHRQNNCLLYKEPVVRKLVRTLEHMDLSAYDAIIPVCAYYEAAEAVMRYVERHGLAVPVMLYQVDPLAENGIYVSMGKEYLIAYEKKLYNLCQCAFTTPIIRAQKQKAGWPVTSLIPLEFPLADEPTFSEALSKPGQEIRCVFTGMLYGNLRDVRYTLELFSRFTNPHIQLYIIGYGQEALLNEYEQEKLRGRLHYLGKKTEELCNQWLAGADVLINIGNAVLNQVPSKLFQYISFGKPILNIVKSDACPCLPYVNRYPLALYIKDTTEVTDEDAQRAEAWIAENKAKQIDYQTIEQIFNTCTPAYIAKQLFTQVDVVTKRSQAE